MSVIEGLGDEGQHFEWDIERGIWQERQESWDTAPKEMNFVSAFHQTMKLCDLFVMVAGTHAS